MDGLDKAEGVIFSNWSIGEFNSSNGIVYGQDYGFSNDPSTLIATSIDKGRKIIYLKELLYKPGLQTTPLYNVMKPLVGNRLSYR